MSAGKGEDDTDRGEVGRGIEAGLSGTACASIAVKGEAFISLASVREDPLAQVVPIFCVTCSSLEGQRVTGCWRSR